MAVGFAAQLMNPIDRCSERVDLDHEQRPSFPKARRASRGRLIRAGIVATIVLRACDHPRTATARPTRLPTPAAGLREQNARASAASSSPHVTDSTKSIPLDILAGNFEPLESTDPELPAEVLHKGSSRATRSPEKSQSGKETKARKGGKPLLDNLNFVQV